MLKSILLSAVIMLLFAGLTYSQIEKKVPQYLLDQLEIAEDNENIEESNRITNIINTKYNDGTYLCNSNITMDEETVSGSDECIYNPPYNPDWMSSDVLVYDHTGATNNITHRTLDMEYCEENGFLYIAACVNISGWHGIRVWYSSNSGLTWASAGTVHSESTYWTGLSMKVEQRRNGFPDSVRVNIFCTRSASTNNDDAYLRFYSFKPHASSPDWIMITVATPIAGNELAFPSAYSNGQFFEAGTDIGCIVGAYNNAGTDCDKIIRIWMLNWTWSFSGNFYHAYSNNYFYPSAVYKNNAWGATDSVYIAFELRETSLSKIRVIIYPAWNNVGGNSLYVAEALNTYYRKPCLTIPQNRYPTRMVITYTENATSSATTGRGRRSSSQNGGVTWTHGYLSDSYSTIYTWVSSDSNQTSGCFTFIWGDSDSLNVRRSNVSFSGGTYYYDRANYYVSSTCFPVCAVYNNSSGNFRRSTFVYWRYLPTGPSDIYFDAEDLPTGITNTNGIANTYNLSQNFPNPFNPTTTIKFGIPRNGFVKLVVYDVLGKEVAVLVNNEKTTGTYEVTFDASKLNSGVYFYKITSGDFSGVKKMLLVK